MRVSSRALGGRLAAMVPAVLLGMACGFGGGAWAAGSLDATPYDRTDLNTATRTARQAGSSEGWTKARQAAARATARIQSLNEDKVGLVEARLAAMRKAHEKAQTKADKRAAEQQAKVARLQSSLAETTAALSNATTGGGGPANGQSVEGTLRSTWVLRGDDLPWPDDCAKPLQTYQVRVTAGAEATVATARLLDAEVVRRTPEPKVDRPEKKGSTRPTRESAKKVTGELVCSMTYSAKVPTPLGEGYRFVVVNADRANTPLQTAPAASAALGNGKGPALSVTWRAS